MNINDDILWWMELLWKTYGREGSDFWYIPSSEHIGAEIGLTTESGVKIRTKFHLNATVKDITMWLHEQSKITHS